MEIPGPYCIALDVGGTSVKSGVVVPPGLIVGPLVTTPAGSGADAGTIFATLATIIRGHLRGEPDAGGYLLGVALAFPGPFDYRRGVSHIRSVAKYEALYGRDVRAALAARVPINGRRIVFRNDAEAAIVGEARYGAGKPYRRLLGVTLGTGCGSAFVLDGVPVTAGRGVPPHGWLYPLLFEGRQADDQFSIRGLLADLEASGVVVGNLQEAAGEARSRNGAARRVFAGFGERLGRFLLPFAAGFEADAVVLAGGIANTYDLFGDHVSRLLPVPVLPGALGPRAALLGAAELLLT